MKLINQPFDGDKRKLKEFVDNVTTAFEIVNPNAQDLLLTTVYYLKQARSIETCRNEC
jgi:hypothetical protein